MILAFYITLHGKKVDWFGEFIILFLNKLTPVDKTKYGLKQNEKNKALN